MTGLSLEIFLGHVDFLSFLPFLLLSSSVQLQNEFLCVDFFGYLFVFVVGVKKLYGDDGKMVEHYATEHNRLEEAIMDTKSVPVSTEVTRAVLEQLFPDLLIFL